MKISKQRYSSEALFAELDGEEFRTFKDLETRVLEQFNGHLADFPLQFSYRDLILLAQKKNWLKSKDGKLQVRVA